MSRRQHKRGRPRQRTCCRTLPGVTKNPGGRPKGILKRFPFEQTRLGFMLKYESPVVYDLIICLSPQNRKRNPHAQLIAIVCMASRDPAFEKPKFRVYFEEYVRNGLYCKRGKKLTPEREQYYERLRGHKLQQYIHRHKDEIELLRTASDSQEE